MSLLFLREAELMNSIPKYSDGYSVWKGSYCNPANLLLPTSLDEPICTFKAIYLHRTQTQKTHTSQRFKVPLGRAYPRLFCSFCQHHMHHQSILCCQPFDSTSVLAQYLRVEYWGPAWWPSS